MRLFRVDSDNKFVEYNVKEFKKEHKEEDLENLLEENPDAILEEGILLIGRQVTTNLNTYLDLLGLDRKGNTIIIELKRDRTPRDTIAQALEYASFIEPLDYSQLETIYQEYTGNENEALSDYHRDFFKLNEGEVVDFNRNQQIVIVGTKITREIRQQAIFLNRKGVSTLCVEFNYFQTKSGETLLSTDIVIGDEQLKAKQISSEKRPIINKSIFLERSDEFGKPFFAAIFATAEKKGYPIHWGSVGYSLNVEIDGKHVSFSEGYPPRKKGTQIVYVHFNNLLKKVENIDDLIEKYKEKFLATNKFEPSGINLKWLIIKQVSQQEIEKIINLFIKMAEELKEKSLIK